MQIDEGEEDDLESRVNALSTWMLDHGLESSQISNVSIQTSSVHSEGRCLISKRTMSKNSPPLVKIPVKFLINYRFAFANAKLNSFLHWYHNSSNVDSTRRLTRYDAILLLLLNARLNPDDDHDHDEFMAKFIATLPRNFDTPEYFDPSLIDLLPYHVKCEVKSRLADLSEKFATLRGLFEAYAVSNRPLFQLDKFTWDVFKWAFCSMNSRVFYMDEKELCNKEEIELAKMYFGDLTESTRKQQNQDIKTLNGIIYNYNFFNFDHLEK